MEKNLHNTDDIFKKAYQQYEEKPSDAVWEKLQSALDKKDAEKYKRKFLGWKRVAILLFLALSTALVYKTNFLSFKDPDTKETYQAAILPEKKSPLSKEANKNKKVQQALTKKSPSGALPFARDSQVYSNHYDENDNEVRRNSVAIPDADNNAGNAAANTAGSSAENTIAVKKERKNTAQSADAATSIILIKPAKEKKEISDHKTIVPAEHKYAQHNNHLVLSDKKDNKKTHTFYQHKNTDDLSDHNFEQRQYTMSSVEEKEKPNHKTGSPLFLESMTSVTHDSLLIRAQLVTGKNSRSAFIKPYWSVTGFASNDWGFYNLDNEQNEHDNSGRIHDSKEEIHERENHESSFSAGIMATRQFKYWGIKTGITYSAMRISINPQEMFAAQTPDGSIAYKFIASSGYGYVKPGAGGNPAVGDSLQSQTAQHNLQALSVPVMISYKLGKNKFSIMPSAGVSANLITKATVTTAIPGPLNTESVEIKKLDGMHKLYIAFVTDVNLQYDINNNWSVNVIPALKYAISPLTKDNVVKTYPYSIGIGGGLTYRF